MVQRGHCGEKMYPIFTIYLCCYYICGRDRSRKHTLSVRRRKKSAIFEKGAERMKSSIADTTYVKKGRNRSDIFGWRLFLGGWKSQESLPGVISAVSGYANGNPEIIPTYELVCTGKTGYKECVRVEYSKDKISLETILFFLQSNRCHCQQQTGQ